MPYSNFLLRANFVIGLVLSVILTSENISAAQTFRDQLKVYDRDDIHSIHKKLYSKEGRHEFTVPLGGIFNNNGFGLAGLQYEYHIFENLGIEAVNGLFGFQFNDDDKLYIYQASMSFSPLYGKMSFFTWGVANFDVYIIGGGGVVKYTGKEDGSSFMGNIGIGERFFINEFLAVKLEFRDYIYKRNFTGGSSILNNYTLTGGVSLFVPFRQKY